MTRNTIFTSHTNYPPPPARGSAYQPQASLANSSITSPAGSPARPPRGGAPSPVAGGPGAKGRRLMLHEERRLPRQVIGKTGRTAGLQKTTKQ